MKREILHGVLGVSVGILILGILVMLYKQQMPSGQPKSEVTLDSNLIQNTPKEKEGVESTSSGTPNKAPSLALNIITPTDGSVVINSPFNLQGRVTPGAIVEINEEFIAVMEDGSFSYPVVLFSGENEIIITASDEWGNSQEKTINVTLESN